MISLSCMLETQKSIIFGEKCIHVSTQKRINHLFNTKAHTEKKQHSASEWENNKDDDEEEVE